eukprot:Skav220526  [mRNA]  locus=scaffold6435:38630:40188:- [translate_table: standard]
MDAATRAPTTEELKRPHPQWCQRTRRFNGACDRCHIPGVLSGPEEVQRPWCPVDILESVTYKEPWPGRRQELGIS